MQSEGRGYLFLPAGVATYITGLSGFGATLAGWAISSHLLWLAISAAAAAAVSGGLAFCVGYRTTASIKHMAFVASLGIAVLAAFVVHRTVMLSIESTSTSTTSATSAKQTTISNKSETDGDNAPAIAGGSGNSVTYTGTPPPTQKAKARKTK